MQHVPTWHAPTIGRSMMEFTRSTAAARVIDDAVLRILGRSMPA